MASAAEKKAQADADFEQVVRVVGYAIEDIANLNHSEWFRHDDTIRSHIIERPDEEFTFVKSGYSRYKPTHIAYSLFIPQSAGLKPFKIWVLDPVEDTAVNRQAAVKALERLRTQLNAHTVRSLSNPQIMSFSGLIMQNAVLTLPSLLPAPSDVTISFVMSSKARRHTLDSFPPCIRAVQPT